MKTFYTLVMIIICSCALTLAQEKNVDVAGSFTIDSSKSEIAINIVVSNNNDVGIYFPLSHWDFDGIMNSRDRYFGYGDKTYIVQRIRFYPDSLRQGYFVGDKGWWPEYTFLPKFLFVKKGGKDSIKIIIGGEKGKLLSSGIFSFEVELCFATTYEMRLLEQIIPEATFKNIVETRAPVIWISKFRGVTEQNFSSVQVPRDRSEFIRELIRFWKSASISKSR